MNKTPASPDLPPLPKPVVPNIHAPAGEAYRKGWYSADQMRAYALAALASLPAQEPREGDVYLTSTLRVDPVAVDHQPASAEQMRDLDRKLGLVELPPIRVYQETFDRLTAEAAAGGVILQAHVRTLLGVDGDSR